jgi:uncharacterized membrane protein YgdD (TMEM256/DUF423 family)
MTLVQRLHHERHNMTTFIIIGAILGFLGVALGAFGAHALAKRWQDAPNLENAYKSGVQYHMYHTLALLVVAWLSSEWASGLVSIAGWLFVLGILLFSGSLYALSISGKRALGAITPLGGLAFLAGWACLLLAALQGGA